MNQDKLDDIIAELLVQDKLRRVASRFQEPQHIPEERFFRVKQLDEKKVAAALLESLHDSYEPAIQLTSALTYSTPSSAILNPANYSKPDTFYVHVPNWVNVHRAPFHTFGSNLFGLAYTSSGDVHIRDDLDGDEFNEVLLHEVRHVMYPNCTEQEIRWSVLSSLGHRAQIHQRIGPG